MSFEEEFPSLKCQLASYPEMNKDGLWIEDKYVEAHCLDKERVRNAIDKILPPHCKCDDLCSSCEDPNEELKKELGL